MTDGFADCVPTEPPEGSPLADLFGGALTVGDPYPIYQRMRDQRIIDGPGCGPPSMHVSRYDDVQALLRHPAAGSDARLGRAYADQVTSGALSADDRESLELRSFLHLDPPDHTRLRRLVTKAVTSRRMVELRPMVQRIIDGAIEDAAERGSLDQGREQLCCFDPTSLVEAPTEVFGGARRRRDRSLAYYAKVVADRRGQPGNDLIAALVAARHDGDRLSDDELVNTIRLMFVGGHETTVSLIANGALALLRHLDQLELLRLRPELWGQAIEEIIRFDAPFQFVHRTATADIELDGATIAAGTHLIMRLGAANRDPAAFVDPDRFGITRQDKRHLGFGGGIHACMGAPLARMQAEVALRAIIERLVDPALPADAPPVYHDDAVHALRSLPITFTSVQQASTALVSS